VGVGRFVGAAVDFGPAGAPDGIDAGALDDPGLAIG
jgi:hypothetical protein